MKWVNLILLLSFGHVFAQAQSIADTERAELLKIHQSEREAHFKTDVNLMLERFPEEIISLRDGKIHKSTKVEYRKRFEEYFRGAKYYEWEDLEPPIIRVSKDASMAWMIVRVKVRRILKDEPAGDEKESKFIYAGIWTYEKQGGKWTRLANVSTFELLK
jgi:hypothetical protein